MGIISNEEYEEKRRKLLKNMGAAVGFAALGLGCSKEATANEASSAGGDANALASAKNKGDKKMKGGGMQRVGSEFAETIGDAAKILPPKAFSGSSIKSSVAALEAFAAERMSGK